MLYSFLSLNPPTYTHRRTYHPPPTPSMTPYARGMGKSRPSSHRSSTPTPLPPVLASPVPQLTWDHSRTSKSCRERNWQPPRLQNNLFGRGRGTPTGATAAAAAPKRAAPRLPAVRHLLLLASLDNFFDEEKAAEFVDRVRRAADVDTLDEGGGAERHPGAADSAAKYKKKRVGQGLRGCYHRRRRRRRRWLTTR